MTLANQLISASVPGLRGPGLTEADRAYVDTATQAGNLAAKQGFPYPLTVGFCDVTLTNAAPTTVTFVAGGHFLERRMLRGVKIEAAAAGILVLALARRTYDARFYTVAGTVLSIPHVAGTVEITADQIAAANGGLPLVGEPGDLLAFNSTGGICYSASTEPYYVFLAPGLILGGQLYLNPVATGATFAFEANFMCAATAEPQADIVLERFDRFSAIPPDCLQIGSYAVDGNGGIDLSPDAYFGHQLVTQRSTTFDRRAIEIDFQFNAANGRFQVTTNPTTPNDSGQFEGSGICIQADTGKLVVYQRWDGQPAGATIDPSTGLPYVDPADIVQITYLDGTAWPLVAGRPYHLRWELDGRTMLVRLTDKKGLGYFEHIIDNLGRDGYSTDLGTHTRYGLMHGSVSFASPQGGAKLLTYSMTAPFNAGMLAHIEGDSRTAGYNVLVGQRYGDLIAADHQPREIGLSGCGGRSTYGGLNSLFFELDACRPARVSVNLGANPETADPTARHAVFAADMALIAKLIRNVGAQPIFVTSPFDGTEAAAVKAIPGVTIVDVGAAMTVNGSGSGSYEYLYYQTYQDTGAHKASDMVHEGIVGHQRVRAQFRCDAGL